MPLISSRGPLKGLHNLIYWYPSGTVHFVQGRRFCYEYLGYEIKMWSRHASYAVPWYGTAVVFYNRVKLTHNTVVGWMWNCGKLKNMICVTAKLRQL